MLAIREFTAHVDVKIFTFDRNILIISYFGNFPKNFLCQIIIFLFHRMPAYLCQDAIIQMGKN